MIPILPLLPLYLDMSDSSDDDAFQGQVTKTNAADVQMCTQTYRQGSCCRWCYRWCAYVRVCGN